MGVSLKTHQKGLFLPFPNPLARPEPSAHQSTIYRVGNVGLEQAEAVPIRLVFSNGIICIMFCKCRQLHRTNIYDIW